MELYFSVFAFQRCQCRNYAHEFGGHAESRFPEWNVACVPRLQKRFRVGWSGCDERVLSLPQKYRPFSYLQWLQLMQFFQLVLMSTGWLHELPCDMNYRVQFCKSDQFNDNGLEVNCTQAEENGISVLHGNRKRFDNFEMTRNIFIAFKEVSQQC